MSMPDRDTVESVEKLLAERRKIANWLSALDARRADTPLSVYQRVHDDYTGKLDKVQAKLTAASDAVQQVAADVASRLIDKEQVLSSKQEDRAEAELRAAVGEYSEREWEKRRTRLDDEIATAAGERDALRDELSRLRSVLGDVAVEVVEEPPPVMPEELPSAPEVPELLEDINAFAPVEAAEPELPTIQIHEQSPIAAVEPALPLGPSFNELEFLKTVVGRPTPLGVPTVPVEAAPEQIAPLESTIQSRGEYEVPEPPLEYPDAMPEPRVSQEMTPPRESFFGRPTPGVLEAGKSLKCQECGTLNFPTEWYCERCGGELAAM